MRLRRFSIASMMGFVVLLAVGMAALRYPTKLWASLFLSVTLVVLVVAVLGGLFRRGLDRSFWAGFALCGWFYFILSCGPWFNDVVSPLLFTTACLDLIYPHVAAPEQTAMVLMEPGSIGLAGGFGGPPPPPKSIWDHWWDIDNAAAGFSVANNFDVNRSLPFQLIGHSLLALIFGYTGGVIARRFARAGLAAPTVA
jgi:hypothetical protein